MAGLLSSAAAPPAGGAAAPPNRTDGMRAEEAEAGQDEASNVTPEEQAAYEAFVDNGYSMIYDKNILPKITEQLKSDQPVPALARTAAMVVMALEDSARQGGMELPEGVSFHGGIELLEDLANLAREAGIHEYSDQEIETALYQGLDLYRETRQQQGMIDHEARQAELAQLQQADKAGELEKMLPPGTKEHFAKMAGGGQAAAG